MVVQVHRLVIGAVDPLAVVARDERDKRIRRAEGVGPCQRNESGDARRERQASPGLDSACRWSGGSRQYPHRHSPIQVQEGRDFVAQPPCDILKMPQLSGWPSYLNGVHAAQAGRAVRGGRSSDAGPRPWARHGSS